jgi:outer membrane receptor for ferric coprogen and ferric-rhodotorulic acid
VLRLSPFTVAAGDVKGYQATTTLAGTRIRTDLKDVASTISVYTGQFLEDVGAANATDLLVYATGVEVAGAGGTYTNRGTTNFGFDLAPERFVPNSTTRVRGLAEADITRGSYRTIIPLDAYNTDRVTVNRGANSILYGLGSPAGIIDTTLVGPGNRNEASLTTRFGAYDSLRNVLDVNRVLLNGKLNARLVALHDRKGFEQEPSFDKNRRIYSAIDAQIGAGFRLRASVEFGDRDGVPENLEPPRDRLTNWWTYGRPVKQLGDNGSTNTSLPNVSAPIDIAGSNPPRGAVVFYDNGALQNPTWAQLTLPTGAGLVLPQILPGDPLYDRLTPAQRANYGPLYGTMDDLARANLWVLKNNLPNPAAALGKSTQIVDRSIFDYVNNNLSGRNDHRFSRFSAVNVGLDRTFFDDDLGLELAYDGQVMNYGSVDFLGTNFRARNIGIDLNATRYDGSPNPNLGRPFVLAAPLWSESRQKSDTYRLTAFAKFDAAKRISPAWSWLGKHSLTTALERNETDSRTYGGSLFAYDKAFGNSIGYAAASNLVTNDLRGQMLFYVGPSLLNAASPAGANITRLPDHIPLPQSATITYTDQATRRIVTRSFNTYTYPKDKAVLTGSAAKQARETDSLALALQSKWWRDKLVTTLGWRRDRFEMFDAGAAPQDALGTRLVDDPRWAFGSTPALNVRVESRSAGAVLHAPRFIKDRLPWGMDVSLNYSTSENFSPNAAGRNPYGGFFPTPSGETDDYGFTLSFLDNRISFRFTQYETKQKNLTDPRVNQAYDWAFRGLPTDIYASNSLAAITAAGFELPDKRIRDAVGWQFITNADGSTRLQTTYGVTDVVDAVSKGKEFELTANLTSGWRVLFNAAEQEARRTGTYQTSGAEFLRLANAWYNNLAVRNGLLGPGGNPSHVGIQQPQQMAAFRAVLAQEGKQADELRKWRFNAVTTYSFGRESRFRGLDVGTGVRWQDKVVIGYKAKMDPAAGYISDLDQPVHGPTELITDVWAGYKLRRTFWKGVRASVQLNVRNVFDRDSLIPIWYNPAETNLAPYVYKTQRGRDWFLTTKLTF